MYYCLYIIEEEIDVQGDLVSHSKSHRGKCKTYRLESRLSDSKFIVLTIKMMPIRKLIIDLVAVICKD